VKLPLAFNRCVRTVVAPVLEMLLDYVALGREGMESGLKESATLFVAVVEDGYAQREPRGRSFVSGDRRRHRCGACIETASILK
jgi:hypothetical protein